MTNQTEIPGLPPAPPAPEPNDGLTAERRAELERTALPLVENDPWLVPVGAIPDPALRPRRPGLPWFCWVSWRWGAWFRIKGYGLSLDCQPPLFSERRGITKPLLRVGNWRLKALKP